MSETLMRNPAESSKHTAFLSMLKSTPHALVSGAFDNPAEISGKGIIREESGFGVAGSAAVQCRGRIGRLLRLPDEQVTLPESHGFEFSQSGNPVPGVQSCGGSHIPSEFEEEKENAGFHRPANISPRVMLTMKSDYIFKSFAEEKETGFRNQADEPDVASQPSKLFEDEPLFKSFVEAVKKQNRNRVFYPDMSEIAFGANSFASAKRKPAISEHAQNNHGLKPVACCFDKEGGAK